MMKKPSGVEATCFGLEMAIASGSLGKMILGHFQEQNFGNQENVLGDYRAS